jgi:FkbM family methyltransferase
MSFGVVKDWAISLGLYRPARRLHRSLFRSKQRKFVAHQRLFSHFIKSGDLVFDVGANIGDICDVMISIGANVVAFEPQPKCAREIRARSRSHLTVVEAAVGQASGFADLHIKQTSTQASFLPDWQGGPNVNVLRVPIVTLDEAISKYGLPSFCKIDVEGYELEVLKGLSVPINLNFEYHCDERGAQKVGQCFRELSRLGDFTVNMVGEDYSEWLLERWLHPVEMLNIFPSCAGRYFYGDIFVRYR